MRRHSRRSLVLEQLESRDLMSVTAPAAPVSFAATPVSPSEVSLTWDLGDAADTGLVVQRRSGAAGSFQTLANLPGGEHIFTDTSCWAGTSYTYRILAQNAAGQSPWSAALTATTPAVPANALATVTTLHAVATSPTTAVVSFTDPNTADHYRSYLLERSADGVSYQTVASLEQATSFSDVNLTPGATYSYRVVAAAWDAPDSDYSAPAAVTEPLRPAPAPVEPSALQVAGFTSTTATLTWQNNDPSAPQFEIDRAAYNPWVSVQTWTKVAMTAPGATGFTDTGLSPEYAYAYRVRAVNSQGLTSDFAAPASDVMKAIFGDGVGVATASKGTGTPKTYDIGPGYQYQSLNDLNWSLLGPGDTVNIHYKPGGYHEMLEISTRGTPSQWITINGIPDPVTGALPTIDGYNAVVAPQFENHYSPVDGSGGIVVGTRPGFDAGYKPGYILIENLHVQDFYEGDPGSAPNTYTDYDGSVKPYGLVGAGIYLERCDHVTIKGCVVNNNGEGIFGAGQSGFDRLMTDITIDSSSIYGNGDVGSYLEHDSYIEAINTLYQYNTYGPLRAGATGGTLKDRGVGTVIRYNDLAGSTHQLDLVESQNMVDLAMALPEYHATYVYGNLIVNPPADASTPILYGGDLGDTAYYRKGILYLYDNTIVGRADRSQSYSETMIQCASEGEAVEATDNIFASISNTTGAPAPFLYLARPGSNVYFGKNWVSQGYLTVNPYAGAPATHLAGLGNLLVGSSLDPGFVNLAAGDYRLAAGSPCIDAAARLPGATAAYPVDHEYVNAQGGSPRPVVGAAPGLGAFEYGTYVCPPPANTTGGSTTGPALVVDDGQAGYSESGPGWMGPPWFSGTYNNECRIATGISGNVSASWQITGLAAGSYSVQASWPGYHNFGTSVPYRIYDGNTLVATVRVNQQVTASGTTVNGTAFQTLATVPITSGTLRVVVGSDGFNGWYVCADAVRLVPTAAPARQAVNPTFDTAAGTYTLAFSAPQQIVGQTIRVLVDGTVAATLTAPGTGSATCTSAPFKLTAGLHTVTFAVAGPNGDTSILPGSLALNLVG
jgi:parallel beta-helix repeat protein